jgi:hypothetical protein
MKGPETLEFLDWLENLGPVSLGINFLAPMRKHRMFNCVYCQCGWTGAAEPFEQRYG